MFNQALTYKLLWARHHPRQCTKKFRDVQKGVPNFRSHFREISTSYCGKPAVILATWTQAAKNFGRFDRQEVFCFEHAREFATRHGLPMTIYTDQSALQMMEEFKELGGSPEDTAALRAWIITHGEFNLETEDWTTVELNYETHP
jgi:hypothetical protein